MSRTRTLIALGVFSVFVSLGFLSFSLYQVFSVPPLQVEAKALDSQVLGVSTSCIDEQALLEAFVKTSPAVKIIAGGQVKYINSQNFEPCFHAATEGTNASCAQPSLQVAQTCVDTIINKEIGGFESKQTLTGVGKSIEVIKEDSRINYSLLGTLVTQKFLERWTKFESATPNKSKPQENIVLQAPFLVTDTPSTDGSFASRYIEVDGSRQLLFLWENGKYKKFGISGAKDGYNPIGVFKILNKATNAWSHTANKWMPYWQAFTFSKEQNTMFGIHGLVYWYPGLKETGDRPIIEPESNIGTPKSYGCIRLTVADAKYLFEWSRVGDLVVIHD